MKKYILAVAALLLGLVCLFLALRRHGAPTAGFTAPGRDTSPSQTGTTPGPTAQPTGLRAAIGQMAKIELSPALLEQAVKAVDKAEDSAATRARDGYYERLLLMQGRDRAKEEQVLSKLVAAFGDSPDTLIGAAACSSEFCRVDLRGVGHINVRERWHEGLSSALDPKGLRFFIVDRDDENNTIASYYFGRSTSWTVPDFNALGLM